MVQWVLALNPEQIIALNYRTLLNIYNKTNPKDTLYVVRTIKWAELEPISLKHRYLELL